MKTRKELKQEYKKMKTLMGVFQIRNIVSNMIIIDNSVDMRSKWNRHIAELKLENHKNKSLQKEWNETGEQNFVFEILAELKDKELDDVDYRKELLIFQEIIIEELKIKKDHIYK